MIQLRLVGVDLLPAFEGKVFGKQLLQRDLAEGRVSDVALAIGEGQAKGLQDQVQAVGSERWECGQVKATQNV